MNQYLDFLRDNLLYIMGSEEYTLREMATRCNISVRKLCEILYREDKGIRLDTLDKISSGIGIPIGKLIGETN